MEYDIHQTKVIKFEQLLNLMFSNCNVALRSDLLWCTVETHLQEIYTETK